MSILPNMNKIGYVQSLCMQRMRVSTSVVHKAKLSVEEKLGIKPKPKRPLTPYLRFSMEIRPDVIKDNPNKALPEITKLISEKWKTIDQIKKDELQDAYKNDMLKYQDLQKEYESHLTQSDKDEIKKAKLNIKLEKDKKNIKKKKNVLGCPKRPGTSFVLFSLDKGSLRGKTEFKEWQEKLAQMWKELPDTEKAKYSERYRTEMDEYKKKLKAWEEDMKSKGNDDVDETTNIILVSSLKNKKKCNINNITSSFENKLELKADFGTEEPKNFGNKLELKADFGTEEPKNFGNKLELKADFGTEEPKNFGNKLELKADFGTEKPKNLIYKAQLTFVSLLTILVSYLIYTM